MGVFSLRFFVALCLFVCCMKPIIMREREKKSFITNIYKKMNDD